MAARKASTAAALTAAATNAAAGKPLTNDSPQGEKEGTDDALKETGGAEDGGKADPATEGELPRMIFELEEPFMFEGELVERIDLSKLFDLNLTAMNEIDMQMFQNRYTPGGMMEVTRLYAAFAVAKANHKPYEWLMGMKARDAIRLRRACAAFFTIGL